MINMIRSWFCSHVFEKHVDTDYTIKVKTSYMVSYPYNIRQAYIYCSKCGKVKKLK